MGKAQSHFTRGELDEYCAHTYLTQKEILHCYKTFKAIDPLVLHNNKNAALPNNKILNIPELKQNPFKDRICKVFSTSKDGDMTFEDFLDMMSVFSKNAPRNVKIEYAFRVYDFDEVGVSLQLHILLLLLLFLRRRGLIISIFAVYFFARYLL